MKRPPNRPPCKHGVGFGGITGCPECDKDLPRVPVEDTAELAKYKVMREWRGRAERAEAVLDWLEQKLSRTISNGEHQSLLLMAVTAVPEREPYSLRAIYEAATSPTNAPTPGEREGEEA